MNDGESTDERALQRLRSGDVSPSSRMDDSKHQLVGESQGFGVAHVRLLARLGGAEPNRLFLIGDLGQRSLEPRLCRPALATTRRKLRNNCWPYCRGEHTRNRDTRI
jgi:hypothetical protein